MNIRVRKRLRYQDGPNNNKILEVGIYEVGKDVPKHIADFALACGGHYATVFVEPTEKTVVEAAKSRTSVERPTLRSRGSRSKPNRRNKSKDK